MQLYPAWKYHKDLAPDGQLVASADAEALLGDGWTDNPDPMYVKPAPLGPTIGLPADAVARGYIPKPYPAHRYKRDGTVVEVQNAAEDAALDPDEHSTVPPADAPPSRAPIPFGSARLDPVEPGRVDDQAAAEKKAADEMVAKARELHSTSVENVIAALDGAPAEVLRKVKEMEMLNESGPRVTLVRSINKALEAFEPPPTS